ncbi:MAG: hypothetical protein SV487_02420, partial [Thermodesulfobacteriota bacterium]|nr:hypothetical protein [Thermodesulfobacteriota bacterium]
DTELMLLELKKGGFEPEWEVVRTLEEMTDAGLKPLRVGLRLSRGRGVGRPFIVSFMAIIPQMNPPI